MARAPGGVRARSIPASAGETGITRWGRMGTAVHPRECGGNLRTASIEEVRAGPSPRVRGKRPPRSPDTTRCRSIPASAGETSPVRLDRDLAGVHPRECGGNADVTNFTTTPLGPSPRVRGKRGASGRRRSPSGSIPASAGETRNRRNNLPPTRVHPRECGGNLFTARCDSGQTGPSPRVRGKRGHVALPRIRHGSIPASAGETLAVAFCCASDVGPSPRVRGKQKFYRSGVRVKRSIPASAGETERPGRTREDKRVHPRECGGNLPILTLIFPISGPSPRVRGKRKPDAAPDGRIRSIPASAGETSPLAASWKRARVHPRECGGNARTAALHEHVTGPSPRVRGKRLRTRDPRRVGRSIPASAGETSTRDSSTSRKGVHPRECGGNPCAWAAEDLCTGPSPRVRGKP